MIDRRRGGRPPFWFELLATIAIALAWRALSPPAADPLAPQLAFWGIFFTIIGAIWNGVHTVADGAVATLIVSVRLLWSFAGEIYNGARTVAEVLRSGLFKAWDFLQATYDRILKPAWEKLWRLVDRVQGALERVMAPVIQFLRRIREELLGFYTKWVRPILDTIGVVRKVLAVLSTLHINFARELDRKLAHLEELIDRPFRALLAKVNEVLNLVNLVVTANGLFQRLALVRSITRDFAVIGDEYARWHKEPITQLELAELRKRKVESDDAHQNGIELGKFYRGEHGEFDGIIRELAPAWREAAGLSTGTS